MNSILENAELRSILTLAWGIRFVFIVDIGYRPERIIAPLTFCVDIARPKAHANRDVVSTFNWHTIQLAVFVNYFTNDLELIVGICFDVSL